jgi:hypothetical protein
MGPILTPARDFQSDYVNERTHLHCAYVWVTAGFVNGAQSRGRVTTQPTGRGSRADPCLAGSRKGPELFPAGVQPSDVDVSGITGWSRAERPLGPALSVLE